MQALPCLPTLSKRDEEAGAEEGREGSQVELSGLFDTSALSLYETILVFANKALITGSIMQSESFAHKYGREAMLTNLLPFSPGPTAR